MRKLLTPCSVLSGAMARCFRMHTDLQLTQAGADRPSTGTLSVSGELQPSILDDVTRAVDPLHASQAIRAQLALSTLKRQASGFV